MDEQAQVNGWIPRQGVPRHGPPEHLQLGMWHDPREHLVERVSRDRGLPVAGQEASPLMDDAAGERSGLPLTLTLSLQGRGTILLPSPLRGEGEGGGCREIEAMPLATVF